MTACRQTSYLTPALLLLVLLASSCSVPYWQTRGSLNDIPLLSETGSEAALFFRDEEPLKPFLKISILQVTGRRFQTHDQLVPGLREQATRQGYDAVVGIEKRNTFESNSTLLDVLLLNSEDENDSYYASALSGFGVKYLENMGYIESFRKSMEIYELQPDTSYMQLLSTARFNYFGEFEEEDKPALIKGRIYQYEVEPYDFIHLLEEEKDWWHRQNSLGLVMVRKKMQHGSLLRKCKIQYTSYNQIKKLKVYNSQSVHTHSIEPVYNNEGLLTLKKITFSDGTTMHEQLRYDERQRHIGSTWLRTGENGPQPFLKTVIDYHSMQDIKKLVVNPAG